jgi:DNA gyrase subunit A
LVGDDQEVIIISREGQTIRLGLKDIPQLGRATQGVRIMRLNDGDSVVSLALVEKVIDIPEEDAQTDKKTTEEAEEE